MGQIPEPAVANVLLFHTVGLIGSLAVRSGALAVPEDHGPLGDSCTGFHSRERKLYCITLNTA
ncbi:MAG: hypothetical protein HFH96_04680 [Lachnospiraceae bacterium]|jgi:hypothetical protein|nr:hypothetical protein [uncultured Acetatifactor sp.]MCI9230399.1 hypothetical protein [Lachnospiraceae bacterium]